MAIELELQLELQRLQHKFGRGKELSIVYEPRMPVEATRELPFGEVCELCGEVINNEIRIYIADFHDALHTLRHEFFEYVFDQDLIQPYVILYNQMKIAHEKAFMHDTYRRKESLIEIIVKNEEQEEFELKKTGDEKNEQNENLRNRIKKHFKRR